MFSSACKEDGDLAIMGDEGQMNGTILGLPGSIFLAEFCATLAATYAA